MILVYRPDEGDVQQWDLADTKFTFAEAKAAEKAGHFQWVRLDQELSDGNIEVLQALTWVLRKRSEPALTLQDLDELSMDSVSVEYGSAEKAFMRAQVDSDASLNDEEKAAALLILGITDEDDDAPKE